VEPGRGKVPISTSRQPRRTTLHLHSRSPQPQANPLFHPSPMQYEPDSTGVEFAPIGPHVPLNEFSTPCEDLCAPEDQCGICHELLVGLGNRALVCARCQAAHPFHQECLQEWVNGSAMPNANTCPLDREVLCEGRGKVHMVWQL
jgi:hypothetical protein